MVEKAHLDSECRFEGSIRRELLSLEMSTSSLCIEVNQCFVGVDCRGSNVRHITIELHNSVKRNDDIL